MGKLSDKLITSLTRVLKLEELLHIQAAQGMTRVRYQLSSIAYENDKETKDRTEQHTIITIINIYLICIV